MISTTGRIPFMNIKAQNDQLQGEISEAIDQVIKRGDFTLGADVELFEKEFADYCATPFAVGVGSGTDALSLALMALDIGPGSEVILPANTFIATAEAVWMSGATPILADIEPETFNLHIADVERRITDRTRAIIPVHLYGQPADMQMISGLAMTYGLKVIEDACQAHGATYHERPVGSYGDAAAFSFYPGKNLGGFGDGGMVVTSDEDVYQRIKQLRDHGQTAKSVHEHKGVCSRLHSIQAAVLRAKLPYLPAWNKLRQKVASAYTSQLIASPVLPPATWANRTHVHHLYVVRVKNRNRVRKYLADRGIETGVHYPTPIHLQPAFADLGFGRGAFPVVEKAAEEILSLPLFPELSFDEIKRVANVLMEACEKFESR